MGGSVPVWYRGECCRGETLTYEASYIKIKHALTENKFCRLFCGVSKGRPLLPHTIEVTCRIRSHVALAHPGGVPRLSGIHFYCWSLGLDRVKGQQVVPASEPRSQCVKGQAQLTSVDLCWKRATSLVELKVDSSRQNIKIEMLFQTQQKTQSCFD